MLVRAVVVMDVTTGVRLTPKGRLPKKERQRLIDGIEDCLSRAPADLSVWHAEVVEFEGPGDAPVPSASEERS